MNIILYVVIIALAVAVLAVACGREALKKYTAESNQAMVLRESGYAVGLAGALVVAYGFIVAALTTNDHWSTPWLFGLGYIGATVVSIFMYYWWKEWRSTIVECKKHRAMRIKLASR